MVCRRLKACWRNKPKNASLWKVLLTPSARASPLDFPVPTALAGYPKQAATIVGTALTTAERAAWKTQTALL